MLWFLRGLRRGVVTTRYPARADASASHLPSPPFVRAELVTSALADRLVGVCAPGALRREGDELVLDLGRCTGCGCCVDAGEGALVPSGRFELATRDRSALVKRIGIGGGG
jgi:ferredoxin